MKATIAYLNTPAGILILQLIVVLVLILAYVGALWYSVLFKFVQVFVCVFAIFALTLLLDKVQIKYKATKQKEE
jgi:hypothetical protein